jgi:hypothetical protein
VVTVCGECESAHAQSRGGEVEVSSATVDMARCDGEVHDLREDENVVRRAIPEKVRRRVMDRDGRRCRVPGCRSMSDLHVHHEDGWRRGHDPERMVTVCGAHHRLRHEGALVIEGSASEGFVFRLQDGTELGVSWCEGFSGENSGAGTEVRESQIEGFSGENFGAGVAARPEDVRAAVGALVRLKLPVREAERRVQVALAGGSVGLEELIRASLRSG